MNNPVCWFEIYVDDMARAKKFYADVFGVELESGGMPDIEMWIFSYDENAYGATGALVKMAGCPAGRNSAIVYFSCEDCAVAQAKVAPAGGGVIKEKFAIGEHGFIALVADSEGNTIGLHSLK